MSDLLKLTSMCNRAAVPVINQPQLIYVLTEIVPGELISKVRLPLNFSLVLDHSGSMAGEKLRTMKEAVNHIIDQLTMEDMISIITFQSRTEILAPAQPAKDKEALKRAVNKIRDGGGTNVAPALQAALRQVSQSLSPERVSRIILLTDGEATDREEDSRRIADEAGSNGVPIIGLGFGQEWKEDFLFDLADRSIQAVPGSRLGMADYIPMPKDADQIFNEVYQSMQVIALDVTVSLRMVQGLEARRVWQVAPLIHDLGHDVIQGRTILIQTGQLEKSGVAYLAEIMLPPRPEGAVRIAQADLTYQAPMQGLQRQAADLVVQYSNDPALHNQLVGHIMNVVEKVQAFRLQTQALDDAQVGDVNNATRKLRQAVTILLSQGETELAGQMQQEADRLEVSGQVSNQGKKTIMLTSRKTVKLSE
jgi:Ca-activated chloride channel family protein